MYKKRLLIGLVSAAALTSTISLVACSTVNSQSQDDNSKPSNDFQQVLQGIFGDLKVNKEALGNRQLSDIQTFDELLAIASKPIIIPEGFVGQIISKSLNADKTKMIFKLQFTNSNIENFQPLNLSIGISLDSDQDVGIEDGNGNNDQSSQDAQDVKTLNDFIASLQTNYQVNDAFKNGTLPSFVSSVSVFNSLLANPLQFPQGMNIAASISEVNLQGSTFIRMSLTLNNASNVAMMNLVGFEIDNSQQVLQNALDALHNLSSQSNPLAITLEDKTKIPSLTNSVESLNSLVTGNPFSAIFASGVTFEIKSVSQIDLNGRVIITLSLAFNNSAPQDVAIYLSGFETTPSSNVELDRLAAELNNVSPASNPLQTTISRLDVAPILANPITIAALNSLVAGDPFSPLPEGYSLGMPIDISHIDESNGFVTITVTLHDSNNETRPVTITLKGFTTQAEKNIEDFIETLNLENSRAISQEEAIRNLETIATFEDLNRVLNINSQIFLPDGMNASASDFTLNTQDGSATIKLTFSKGKFAKREALLKLSGFYTDQERQDLSEISIFINSLNLDITKTIKEDATSQGTTNIFTLEELNGILRAQDQIPVTNDFEIFVNEFVLDTTNGSAMVHFTVTKTGSGASQSATLKLSGFFSEEARDDIAIIDAFVDSLNLDVRRPIINSPSIQNVTDVLDLRGLNGLLDLGNKITSESIVIRVTSFNLNLETGQADINLTLTKGESGARNIILKLGGFFTTKDKQDRQDIESFVNSLNLDQSRSIIENDASKSTMQIGSLNKLNSLLLEVNQITPTNGIAVHVVRFNLNRNTGSGEVTLELTKGSVGRARVNLKLDGFYRTSDQQDVQSLDTFISGLNINNAKRIVNTSEAKGTTKIATFEALNNLLVTEDKINPNGISIAVSNFTFGRRDGSATIDLRLTKGPNAIRQVTLRLNGFFTSKDRDTQELNLFINSLNLARVRQVKNDANAKNTIELFTIEELNNILVQRDQINTPSPQINILAFNYAYNGRDGSATVTLAFKLIDSDPIRRDIRLRGLFTEDERQVNRLKNYVNSFNQISPESNPLETTLEKRDVEPIAPATFSIEWLNSLVAGSPYGTPPQDIKIAIAALRPINRLGHFGISLVATLGNFSQNMDVTLKGFTFVSAIKKELLLVKQSFESKGTLSIEGDANRLTIPTINSLSNLNSFVFGNPFEVSNGVSATVTSASQLDQNNNLIVTITLRKGSERVVARVPLFGFFTANQRDLYRRASDTANSLVGQIKNVNPSKVFTEDLRSIPLDNFADLNKLLARAIAPLPNFVYSVSNVDYDNSRKRISFDLTIRHSRFTIVSFTKRFTVDQFRFLNDFEVALQRAIDSSQDRFLPTLSLTALGKKTTINTFHGDGTVNSVPKAVNANELINLFTREDKNKFAFLLNRLGNITIDSTNYTANLSKSVPLSLDPDSESKVSALLAYDYNLTFSNQQLNVKNAPVGGASYKRTAFGKVSRLSPLVYNNDYRSVNNGIWYNRYPDDPNNFDPERFNKNIAIRDYFKTYKTDKDIYFNLEFPKGPQNIAAFSITLWEDRRWFTPPNGFDFIFTRKDGSEKVVSGVSSFQQRRHEAFRNYIGNNVTVTYDYNLSDLTKVELDEFTSVKIKFYKQSQPEIPSIVGLDFYKLVQPGF